MKWLKKKNGEAREENMIIDFVSFSPGLKNPLEFMKDLNIQPPLAGLASCFVGTQYLAIPLSIVPKLNLGTKMVAKMSLASAGVPEPR